MGDVEYMTAFTQVILPIAYAYNPQLVIVSAGFDACVGDPLGGTYSVHNFIYSTLHENYVIFINEIVCQGNVFINNITSCCKRIRYAQTNLHSKDVYCYFDSRLNDNTYFSYLYYY